LATGKMFSVLNAREKGELIVAILTRKNFKRKGHSISFLKRA